jgi:hypothetical protein
MCDKLDCFANCRGVCDCLTDTSDCTFYKKDKDDEIRQSIRQDIWNYTGLRSKPPLNVLVAVRRI